MAEPGLGKKAYYAVSRLTLLRYTAAAYKITTMNFINKSGLCHTLKRMRISLALRCAHLLNYIDWNLIV